MTRPVAVTPLVEQLFRHTAGRLTAAVVRVLGPGRIDLAQDVVQDAMLQALRRWPFHGVPDQPAAWLMRTARNRAIDLLRHERVGRDLEDRLGHHLGLLAEEGERERADDTLNLLLACADPELGAANALPLMLATLAGLSAREIARALLLPEPTVAQRIVRAKRRLAAADSPSGSWTASEERLEIARQAIYLMFSEGHAPATADSVLRHDVAREGVRLALLLADRAGADPASHALAALCCLVAARFPTRADGAGGVVLLDSQDRGAWDAELIRRGLHHLARAAEGDRPTRYHLEAAIAAEHALAPEFGATNWPGIADLYDGLVVLLPTPVIRTNRAVALVMSGRDAEAAAEFAALESEPGVDKWGWFFAARAWYHERRGDRAAMQRDTDRALTLTASAPQRRVLEQRLETRDS